MNTLNKLFIFAAGAAIGSAITWKILKTKYEQLEEELDDDWEEEDDDDDEFYDDLDEEEDEYEPSEEEKEEYENVVDSTGYRNYSVKSEAKKEVVEEDEDVIKPYVISPEEFDDNEDYGTVSLTYYADGVITDELGDIIDDDLLGDIDVSKHFGEYEDDSVFVRDDECKIEYEILADSRRFDEVFPG